MMMLMLVIEEAKYAEGREEKKEQVSWNKKKRCFDENVAINGNTGNSLMVFKRFKASWFLSIYMKNYTFNQEALRAKALKEQEKERKDFYDKQKEGMKGNRAKYREKVSLDS